LKLCGESGEIAEKVGKLFRDRGGLADEAFVDDIELELGDCFWYLSAIANHFGMSLNDVARANLSKLADKRKRGVLEGSGDHR